MSVFGIGDDVYIYTLDLISLGVVNDQNFPVDINYYSSKMLTLVTYKYDVTCNCKITIKQTPCAAFSSAYEDLKFIVWLCAWRAVYCV